MQLDRELSRLYARALVTIARADHQIDLEEGLRISERIAARCSVALSIEDVLEDAPVTAAELADLVADGPFRASIDPRELARMLVEDGAAVLLAKGHIAEEEAILLRSLVAALGVSEDDFAAIVRRSARWVMWEGSGSM